MIYLTQDPFIPLPTLEPWQQDSTHNWQQKPGCKSKGRTAEDFERKKVEYAILKKGDKDVVSEMVNVSS